MKRQLQAKEYETGKADAYRVAINVLGGPPMSALEQERNTRAGCRQLRRARSTGTLVGVYDGGPAGLDTDGGRWHTICDEHGFVCSHDTLETARAFAASPEEWCEPCGAIHRGEPCTQDPSACLLHAWSDQ
jgi:hypothetical protein